jgi:hypothetical protein
MSKQYVFHSDPGHGWLAVKRTELKRLNILKKITPYSYQRGGTVYLEEDCDASTFIKRKEELGEEFSHRESFQENTPIRNYEGFELTEEETMETS